MKTQQPEALRLAHLLALDKWPDAATELRRLHSENQDLRTRHYCNTAEIEALQNRVQELGEMARENRSKRVIELERRIAEMEEQMAAIGAGGVESLRKRAAPAVVAVQEETHVDNLFDAVLNCPHAITAESVTLHFYPKQEGHTALTQLRHRLATYDLAARQREMQLLGEIEALERLALGVLKQPGATPIAWYVTGCSTMLDEHDAKAEAKRCGGSAKAVPLYTHPPTVNQQLTDQFRDATEMMAAPQAVSVPPFAALAQRKLDDLLARGFRITGYSIERADIADWSPQRGFITHGGMVGWWTPNAAATKK